MYYVIRAMFAVVVPVVKIVLLRKGVFLRIGWCISYATSQRVYLSNTDSISLSYHTCVVT